MRARIDITEAEADTKIRGKYLRALENEEWRLLPGPTFVRSFLRTYGDYLGLDGRLLVEEFKLRHERARDEPRPIAPPGTGAAARTAAAAARIGRRRARARAARRQLLLALVGALYPAAARTTAGAAGPRRRRRARSAGGAGVATLRIEPVAGRSTPACTRRRQGASSPTPCSGRRGAATYRSRRLRLTLGSGAARLVVNGRPQLPQSSTPLGYEVTRSGARRLSAARQAALLVSAAA